MNANPNVVVITQGAITIGCFVAVYKIFKVVASVARR